MVKKNSFVKLLKRLANLPLAIGILFTIGNLIAIGTIIEQNQSISFYKENYTETKPVLGFISWKLILFLNLNEIYTSYFFIFLLLLLGSSLLACSFTTQLPALKKFRLWNFLKYPEQFKKFTSKSTQTLKTANNIIFTLYKEDYHIFRQGKKNYAYSGLLGRVAPIVVHFSILLLLLGSTLGSFNGYEAQEIIPRGEIFHIQNLIKSGDLSYVSQNLSWRINDFWITYTKDLKTNQFYSDLSLIDNFGSEIKRKTIFVNEPFVYKGITLYQTDWDILGLKIKINNKLTVQIPLKKINKNGKNFWLGKIVLEEDSKVFTILLNDLKGNLFVYDDKGLLVKECSVGDNLALSTSNTIKFYDIITTTGLQIKIDPGIKVVYTAFFFLMVSAYTSYISYSKVWGIENSAQFIIGGNSNRAVLYFQQEFKKLLQKSK